MKQNMVLRGFSPKTQYAYLNHVRYFENFFERPLKSMGAPEIKEFLHYCITKKNLSRSYVNTTYSVLKFMYETTMNRDWDLKTYSTGQKGKTKRAALRSWAGMSMSVIPAAYMRVSYNSCLNRHCPKCQGLAKERCDIDLPVCPCCGTGKMLRKESCNFRRHLNVIRYG